MQDFEQAGQEFAKAINELLPELKSKYSKVENNGTSIKCYKKNGDFKQIRIIEDYEKRNPSFPKISKQYQLEGGHRELARKMGSKDPNALKVEIKCFSDGQHYEIAPMSDGNLWSKTSFKKEIIGLFLDNLESHA